MIYKPALILPHPSLTVKQEKVEQERRVKSGLKQINSSAPMRHPIGVEYAASILSGKGRVVITERVCPPTLLSY